MRFAYLTTDEVNRAVARRLAKKCGASLYTWPIKGPLPDGQVDAVVYDLDYLPEPRRAEVLVKLSQLPHHPQAAVHSFNLDEDQVRALRANGVRVYHRLELRVFKTFCRNSKRREIGQRI